jgi:lysozyme family protein
MDEKFLRAIDRTLAFEGGYANDLDDPGGETNFGISRRSYPDEDIRNLTRERAIEIYYRDFWMPHGYARISDPNLAAKVFDLAVNMGPSRAHKLLQQAVNFANGPPRLAVDGVLGPKTIEATDETEPAVLLDALRREAVEFYRDLAARKGMEKYLKGWLRRARS